MSDNRSKLHSAENFMSNVLPKNWKTCDLKQRIKRLRPVVTNNSFIPTELSPKKNIFGNENLENSTKQISSLEQLIIELEDRANKICNKDNQHINSVEQQQPICGILTNQTNLPATTTTTTKTTQITTKAIKRTTTSNTGYRLSLTKKPRLLLLNNPKEIQQKNQLDREIHQTKTFINHNNKNYITNNNNNTINTETIANNNMHEYFPHQTAVALSGVSGDFQVLKLSHTNNLNNNNNNNNNSDDVIFNDNGKSNNYQQQQQQQQLHQQQNKPLATLSNIGNTCYLNSVVYTLRFAPLFLHNLHHLVEDLAQINQKLELNKAKSSSLGRNITGLQASSTRSWSTKDLASMSNGGGGSIGSSNGAIIGNGGGGGVGGLVGIGGVSGGINNGKTGETVLPGPMDIQRTKRQIAVEKLHELYFSLHRNELTEQIDAFHADTFLSAVQDVSSIFEGNQQQDAHEFLMCILDSIRETCQSLKKAITDCPDIIVNGYVSLPSEKTIETLPPPTTVPPAKPSSSGRSYFFRKREKSKSKRLDSPSKETPPTVTGASTVSPVTAVVNSNSIVTGDKNHSIDSLTTKSNSLSSVVNSVNGGSTFNSANNANNIGSGGGGGGGGDGGGNGEDEVDKENINEKIAEKIKKMGLDFFSEDFEGVTVSSTKCLSCETVTEQKETMIDLSVPITGYENNINPNSFIQDLCITREQFNGENKYRCEVCTGLTEAIRTISYPVLPRLLIIQLKRFSGGMEKINSYIPTPFSMQCFCSKCCGVPIDSEKPHVYKLYSVITHVGATLSVGHYIAYTCSMGNYDDYFNCPKDRRKSSAAAAAAASTSTGAATTGEDSQSSGTSNLIDSNNSSNSNSNSNSSKLGFGSLPPKNRKGLSSATSAISSDKNVTFIKKIMFIRNKASSTGDVTKNLKNFNGSIKYIDGGGGVNGGGSTSSTQTASPKITNSPCTGLSCCGIVMNSISAIQNQTMKDSIKSTSGGSAATITTTTTTASSSLPLVNGIGNSSSSNNSNSSTNSSINSANEQLKSSLKHTSAYSSTMANNYSNLNGFSLNHHQQNGSGSGGSGGGGGSAGGGTSSSTINGGASNNIDSGNSGYRVRFAPEPIWYMCDDDKIKAMSQREFEDLLSPNSKKIMITPYLLFYVRTDV